MNKLFTTLPLVLLYVSLQAFSLQPNDSVSIGTGYTKMVFYNLSTGAQTEASNTDWHLAFSVRPTPIPPGGNPQEGAVIRINEQNSMSIAVVPTSDAASFNTVDTSGWVNWPKLHDSDSKLIEGALNSNRDLTNAFDFGWGKYNMTSHNLVGDSVFIVSLPGGGVKKLIIESLKKDTAYNIKYSNIDNSDMQQMEIRKSLFAGKNFVYLNLFTNEMKDKEPASASWDLQFLKYTGVNIQGLPVYPVTGVWVNRGVTVAKAEGVDVTSNDYSGHTFATEMNTIGWDWKTFGGAGFTVTDSLVFFTRTAQGRYFKVVFTGFGGSSNGLFKFYKEEIIASTSIEDFRDISWNVYPNPANDFITIKSQIPVTNVSVFTLTGSLVSQSQIDRMQDFAISTDALSNGVYLVAVYSNEGISVKRIVVHH